MLLLTALDAIKICSLYLQLRSEGARELGNQVIMDNYGNFLPTMQQVTGLEPGGYRRQRSKQKASTWPEMPRSVPT